MTSLVSVCNVYIVRETFAFSAENEMRAIMQNFEAQSGFLRIIGAIDGTHIRIRAPVDQTNAYFNRKKYHSFNTQASNSFLVMFLQLP